MEALLWMLIGHAVADYPMQGDWLSKAKNPSLDLVPGQTIWPMALLSHAAIHAGAVKLATGSWDLATALRFSKRIHHQVSGCRRGVPAGGLGAGVIRAGRFPANNGDA